MAGQHPFGAGLSLEEKGEYAETKSAHQDALAHVSVHPGSVIGSGASSDFYDPSKESALTRLGLSFESFKRAPGTTRGLVGHGDIPKELLAHDQPLLQQQMKPRHLQMIAVSGSIGTGLFIGSGSALSTGGPAAVIIAWVVMGVMLMNVVQALGEMAIVYPVSGGFYTLASRFIDPSFACAMAWNYVFQWLITLPLELTAAGFTIQYWTTDVPLGAWITIFWVVIIIFALFGTLGYAEEEFWSSILRLFVVILFIIIGLVCITGKGPKGSVYEHYLGGQYWKDPGAFANGFKGLCYMFVTAAFSYSGTELMGLAATETPDPRRSMPGAVKNSFWRITLIYITSLTVISCALPYNEPLLQIGTGAQTSPFVIVMKKANIKGLDHLVNATICVSVLTIGLSSVYAGSRCMTALAETGYAPRSFRYVDKAGRPLVTVLICLATAPIAYINLANVGATVFNWLVQLSGLSVLFTWLAICISHIRFRKAWVLQGHSVEELPYRAVGGIYGSYLGSVLIVLIIIAQFYIAVWPIGEMPVGRAAAYNFFYTFLSAPIMAAMWLGAWFWKRTTPKSLSEIDLDTGRKSWLTAEQMRAYREERANAPFHIRVFRILFSS
ncbi:Amino-acid permease inda1 [Vanrija pseudolonga]|uniref:Amino-acid permease inda1 n=1 Tax=Vanrija pseudolonga TaxID=143232 RepID=A0AAF1BID3_9TREE|nr:Amino-acid permease inda1 [Vanrija pseudolonga]